MSAPQPEKQLSEKDFIQDDRKKNPFPFLLWGCILSLFVCLMWGGWSWFAKQINYQYAENPFLQVTNRQFSAFLWQFPENMRANVKNKAGYLPAFQIAQRVGMDPLMAEEYVAAPPDIIFLYHAWHRLLFDEFTTRPIPLDEFKEFISYLEEWDPKYWPTAPEGYVKLISTLPSETVQDLSTLPLTTLPQIVRMAFQGWKNYMKEGDAINLIKPKFSEMQDFISSHPHYARNYWRNILSETYPQYLINLTKSAKDEVVPSDELAPFLRAAYFNYAKSKKKE